MTPQCNTITYHCTKQPLIAQNRTVQLFTTSSSNKKRSKNQKKDGNTIKCVLVGDKAVGKTSLAVSYSTDSFPDKYVPTAYDNYNVVVQVDGKPIRVELCDTAGEEFQEFIPLRSLCYPGTDVFMLCFSIINPATFRSAVTRWADELSRLNAAVVLVGTQVDLKTDERVLDRLASNGQRPVSLSDAKELAKRLNAPYIETSAKTGKDLKEAFDMAIIVALKRQNRKKRFWRKFCCCI